MGKNVIYADKKFTIHTVEILTDYSKVYLLFIILFYLLSDSVIA